MISSPLPPAVTTPSAIEQMYITNANVQSARHLGVIVPSIFFGIMAIIFIAVVIYDLLWPTSVKAKLQRSSPEVRDNIILCESDGQFNYLMIIRVGSPTSKFKSKRAWIDFEIIGPDNAVLGKPVRFKWPTFSDIDFAELHCNNFYFSKFPPIKGLQASHNQHVGDIFLFDYALIDCKASVIIEERLFMEKITKNPTLFKGRPAPCGLEAMQVNATQESLPIEWTRFELLIVFTTLTLTIAGLVMIFEFTNFAYFTFRNEDGSLFRSFIDLAIVTPFGIILLFTILKLYEYLKKQVMLVDDTAKQENKSSFECCTWAFLAFLIVLSLVFSGAVLIMGMFIGVTKSLFWLGATFDVSVIVIGIWWLYDTYSAVDSPKRSTTIAGECLTIKESGSMLQKTQHLAQSTAGKAKTVYFTKASSTQANVKQPVKSSSTSNCPKLVNPRLKAASKSTVNGMSMKATARRKEKISSLPANKGKQSASKLMTKGVNKNSHLKKTAGKKTIKDKTPLTSSKKG